MSAIIVPFTPATLTPATRVGRSRGAPKPTRTLARLVKKLEQLDAEATASVAYLERIVDNMLKRLNEEATR